MTEQINTIADALSHVLPHHTLSCVSKLNLDDSQWSYDVSSNGKPLITRDSCQCDYYTKQLRELLPANHPKGFGS